VRGGASRSGLAEAGLGSVQALSLIGCAGPAGLTFSETSNALPWALNAVSYKSGVTSGTTTGLLTSGDPVALSGTYTITPKQKITSP
jgi:hypothetical protein